MSQQEQITARLLANQQKKSRHLQKTNMAPSTENQQRQPDTQSLVYSIDQQQAFMQTTASLLASTTPDELWPTVVTAVRQILTADRSAIFLYDTSLSKVTCPLADGLSADYIENICQQVVNAPSYTLWQVKEPLVINDIQNDVRTEMVRSLMQAEGFRSYAIFPLTTRDDQLLGALIAYRNQLQPFTKNDVAAGQTLAHMSVMALNNIQLFSQTRLNLLREQQLNEFSRSLASVLDLPAILGNVIRTAAEIVAADAGLLGLIIDHQVMTFYPHDIPAHIVLRPAPRGSGIGWRAVQEEKSLYIDDYQAYHLAQDRWLKAGVTSLIAVPIRAVDNYLGSLILFNLKWSSKRFDERELALVESLGRQAGIAIQNARMYAEANQRTAALRNALNRQAELDDLKNKFVQNVSHELRTPLGIIYGHTDLLNSGAMGELAVNQAESIHIIHRRVRMLIDLVDDLTALLATETQELRREEINPSYLAYSMLDEYRLQAKEAGIQLQADISEDLPDILGDITHLRRVFDNLVSNAFKFTPEEGTVTLRVWGQGNHIYIEVADSGVGIPAEKIHRIFERFYQIDGNMTRQYAGTGLGLALVKEIIEAHRGEVSVTSQLGEGTTFHIILPTIEGES